jgi:hypothetical protein
MSTFDKTTCKDPLGPGEQISAEEKEEEEE